ncbi:MAG: DUF2007 domain-containing protein [Candidatus Omnitrophica bacterium]|nr:DUF2007 domain-containing protein [Candidatus Omnitrophota bacterium]
MMEKNQDDIKYKELLLISRPDKVAIVKSILSANNITFRVEGEHFASTYVLAQPCRFMVDERQFSEAEQLLKDFEIG